MDTTVDQFYLSISAKFGSRSQNSVIRYQPILFVEVNENVNHPYIELVVAKHNSQTFDKPRSSKYIKYRPVPNEVFAKKFEAAMNTLKKFNWGEGECFWDQRSPDWTIVALYVEEPRNKISLTIDIRDSLSTTNLTVSLDNSFRERNSFRKSARSIDREVFSQAFQLTKSFISDQISYVINVDSYVAKMQEILNGRYEPTFEKNLDILEAVVDQLQRKKNQIEYQLIHSDEETPTERERLRGEIAGLHYALQVITQVSL